MLIGPKKHRLHNILLITVCLEVDRQLTYKYMGNFQGGGNRGGGFRGRNDGDRPSFQKKSWGADRGGDREKVTMHKATCSDCAKMCEVPFYPSGDKPVYCNDCFGSKREGVDRKPRQDFGNRGPRRDFNDRPALRNDFRPAPVNDDVKKQLMDISTKLDRLLIAIEKFTEPSEEVKKTPVKKVAKKKI